MNSTDCFALLDDRDASDAAPRSRLYSGYNATLTCRHPAELPAMLEGMQQALRQGLHAVWLSDYEFGAKLHGITSHAGDIGQAQVLLFAHCQQLSAVQVEAWLTERSRSAPSTAAASNPMQAGIAAVSANVEEAAFNAAIARIRAYIEAGDTYQVNYTYRLRFDAYGSLHALYLKLRSRQPVPYGALIALPDGRAVLSLSPELFIRHEAGNLTARPMKGTLAATGDAEEDARRAAMLAADPKNRAENLMIVDLLRNDLGRIANPGSIKVPHLFEVNRYSSVLQMISTVTAHLRDDVTLPDIVHALYPCGSITGAPKHRTMQIIDELEPDARGLYTGAIGWFDASNKEQPIPDFCLSVPIRTLVLQAPAADSLRQGEMGVGAGIVYDSVAADEYAECKLKAQFLTGLPQDFELFETMHATRQQGCRHLDLHLQRLQASAAYFGFRYDEKNIRDMLQTACENLPPSNSHRLRLALNHTGICTIHTTSLSPLPEKVHVLLAAEPTLADDLFLRHKSTVRTRYDAAWRAAEAQQAFDMLFFNTRGELTEGGRSNVFIKLDGRWYTPPLAAGVLPGIMRGILLADPKWNASERYLYLRDLRNAEEVVICNALRGVLRADIGFDQHMA